MLARKRYAVPRRTVVLGGRTGGGTSCRPSTDRIPGAAARRASRRPPITPAAISVACAPIAPLTGPVSANDSGSRPIEISQSRLETRPSSCGRDVALLGGRPDDRAGRLERVEGEAGEHQLPDGGREPVAGDRQVASVHATYMKVMSRRGRPRWPDDHGAARPSRRRRRRRPGRGRAALAVEVVLDDERQQHLGRAHEQEVGDGGAGERRPTARRGGGRRRSRRGCRRPPSRRAARGACARSAPSPAARRRRRRTSPRRARTPSRRRRRRSAGRRSPGRRAAARSAGRTGRASSPARAAPAGSTSGTIASNAGPKNAVAAP